MKRTVMVALEPVTLKGADVQAMAMVAACPMVVDKLNVRVEPAGPRTWWARLKRLRYWWHDWYQDVFWDGDNVMIDGISTNPRLAELRLKAGSEMRVLVEHRCTLGERCPGFYVQCMASGTAEV